MAAPAQVQKRASRARDAMRRHEVLASGILTGIAGGVAMLAVAMIGATSQDIPATHPLQVIGESFVGPEAFDRVAAKTAFGALVHLTTSAALGVLLAAIVPRDFPTPSAIGVGVGFALFTLMFTMPLVVPWANPGFRRAMQEIGGSWVLAHAVFGVALGVAPPLRRWLFPEARGASVPERREAGRRAGRVATTTRTM